MVLDLFTFFNELDLLELRLSILDEHVDKFILTESTETFSGVLKPLYYEENKERFAKWNHKIIHNVVGTLETDNSFERAFYQKESPVKYLKDDDKVYFGDLDEIWQPFEGFGKLRQYNYCYYLNQRSSEDWYGTVTGKWSELKGLGLNGNREKAIRLPEFKGWHFTNMGGLDQIIKKIEAYDHQEANLDWVKEALPERIAKGQDYLSRAHDYQGKPFSFYVEKNNWPEYLKENKDKYAAYMRPESI